MDKAYATVVGRLDSRTALRMTAERPVIEGVVKVVASGAKSFFTFRATGAFANLVEDCAIGAKIEVTGDLRTHAGAGTPTVFLEVRNMIVVQAARACLPSKKTDRSRELFEPEPGALINRLPRRLKQA